MLIGQLEIEGATDGEDVAATRGIGQGRQPLNPDDVTIVIDSDRVSRIAGFDQVFATVIGGEIDGGQADAGADTDIQIEVQILGLQLNIIDADQAGALQVEHPAEEDIGNQRFGLHENNAGGQAVDSQAEGIAVGGIAAVDITVAVGIGEVRAADTDKGADLADADGHDRDLDRLAAGQSNLVGAAHGKGRAAAQLQNPQGLEIHIGHRGADDAVIHRQIDGIATGSDGHTVRITVFAREAADKIDGRGIGVGRGQAGEPLRPPVEVNFDIEQIGDDIIDSDQLRRGEITVESDQGREQIIEQRVNIRTHDGQTQVEVIEGQPHGVRVSRPSQLAAVVLDKITTLGIADEAIHILGTDGHDADRKVFDPGQVVADIKAAQGEKQIVGKQRGLCGQPGNNINLGATALFKGKAAAQGHEPEQIDYRLPDLDTDEFSTRHIDIDRVATGFDTETCRRFVRGWEAGLEIGPGGGAMVERYRPFAGFQSHAIDADHAETADTEGAGRHRRHEEAVNRVARVQNSDTAIKIADLQTDCTVVDHAVFKSIAAVADVPGKGIGVGKADGHDTDFDGFGGLGNESFRKLVVDIDLEAVTLLKGEGAADIKEAVDHQGGLRGIGADKGVAVVIDEDGVVVAGWDEVTAAVGKTGLPVDGRIDNTVAAGLVEFDLKPFYGQLETGDTDKASHSDGDASRAHARQIGPVDNP
ncbi:hypothetical protein DSCO28_34570 [Desulfosarcina ovata subsp. sediminis]|uniref:Uncharacterized protein n=1 Tax=Desulfosarcina ovata subsp. sediminis TaxID=885957 RepID=A0A5K7ZNR1_9BACT|nr:hypothetical protein DSCO28_34570 [Desulfosarcina ovata subsp. sediminis]